jgi:hypothetical protein
MWTFTSCESDSQMERRGRVGSIPSRLRSERSRIQILVPEMGYSDWLSLWVLVRLREGGANWIMTISFHASPSGEGPPVLKSLKNFTTRYGTQRFITLLTRALYQPLSWARSIQTIPPHPTPLSCILVLSIHLRLGFPSDIFPSGFPNNNLYVFFFSPFVLHALPV